MSSRKFETILVSIDGPEDLTDANRGTGTYGKVIENIHRMVDSGYDGEIIARMTVCRRDGYPRFSNIPLPEPGFLFFFDTLADGCELLG